MGSVVTGVAELGSSTAPDQVPLPDALGMWVLCNLRGRCPTYEESGPTYTIGKMLEHTFAGWWE